MNRALNGILTWACICGGALTIADYWSNSLHLTDGAQGLLKHWRTILHNFWIRVDSTAAIESEVQLAMALSLILFYLTITVLSSGESRQQTNPGINNESDLSIIYLIIAAVLFTSTAAAFIAEYHYIFVAFDNLFVFMAFAFVVKGNVLTRIIGAIAYTSVYTVLDDYIKSTISLEQEFGAAVSGQLISIFVVFFPLIFISNTTLLTRRISSMLLGAGIIVSFGSFKTIKGT